MELRPNGIRFGERAWAHDQMSSLEQFSIWQVHNSFRRWPNSAQRSQDILPQWDQRDRFHFLSEKVQPFEEPMDRRKPKDDKGNH
jgi:hypothetical protein